MLNSSYDGEIEQWDMIDKYSMNVIYTASVDMLLLITADIVAMLRMNGCMKLCYFLMIN